jgi:hypothetical protein
MEYPKRAKNTVFSVLCDSGIPRPEVGFRVMTKVLMLGLYPDPRAVPASEIVCH